MTGLENDPAGRGVCVCGKTGLVYLYTINNLHTRQSLFPIGSVCVDLFEVAELTADVSVLRGLFELRSAFEGGMRVTLAGEYFTRALLADLWENGAFPSNEYNRGNGENDYKFLLDMFNSRHEPSTRENKKIWVLINKAIKPFVLTDERLA
ncbi:hypothetical protein [Clavibacter michiganensis]|uniref:hypothetical protein n=1 Tax=Clavibacter michiganensis TaxID=28447 RepID=UPI0010568BEC|nr:hypothetical protein [Clavibacter michiganensis]